MGQVLYSLAKEYRIMEGHDREAEALQSGQKTLIPDCSPSVQGLQSVYRRTQVRILKDWF